MATTKKAAVPVAAAPEVQHYLVGATPVLQGGTRFEPGSVIAMPAAQAQRLGLAPAPAQPDQPLE